MSAESQRDNGGHAAEPFLYTPAKAENGARAGRPAGTPPPAHRESATLVPERTNEGPAGQGAYEKGSSDGEARARAAFEKTLAEVRSQITLSLRQFTTERETYFQKVEADVVQLALSIARKILHRESQIDPLLLTGIVRVALEGIDRDTQVRLRANPEEIRFWRDYFTHTDGIRPAPELVGDASLSAGQCVLETELGSTHISFETQLKEIEQGFLDLLGQRPRVNTSVNE